jgi:hypothetical protein
MATTDIREKAKEVRDERASSLKSFFSNCFVPEPTLTEMSTSNIENATDSENAIDSENDTYTENNIYIEKDIRIENATHSGITTYTKNAIDRDITYIENNIHSEKTTRSENSTLENTTYSDNATRENDTHIENTTPQKATHSKDTILENTTRIENTLPENATHSGNDIIENTARSNNTTRENDTYSENAIYDGKTVKLAEILGFTALGVLAVLIDEFPDGRGMLNVTQLAKACGVARTTLIAQLRSLEKCAVITLGNAEKTGRRIEILCVENTTYRDNAIPYPSSSSILNNKNNNYYQGDIYTGNNMRVENETRENNTRSANNTDGVLDIYIEKDIHSNNATYTENNTHLENDIYIENAIVTEKLSKSKITMRIAARELFFTAKASMVNIDKLSKQCFQQFLSVKQSKGANYAIALFHNLLTRSKENPTAYVIRAIQQGAAPSHEDEKRAETISRAGESVLRKIGEEILQRDFDSAIAQLSLAGASQKALWEEIDSFVKRIL